MIQEDKNLLLKDLCARMPYGVIVRVHDIQYGDFDSYVDSISNDCIETYPVEELTIDFNPCVFYKLQDIKPYLRPISSMTEKEMDKLFDILKIDKDGKEEDWIKINDDLGIKFFFSTGKWVENVAEAYDYLHSIHIDFRGLIEKSLAIVVPEGMYKIQ